jgi:hypothetical protein
MNAAEIYLNKIANALTFNPVGPHGGGTTFDITVAHVITRPDGANKLLIQALTQNVRYTINGTNPSATLGFQIVASDAPVIIPFEANTEITVIQETAGAEVQFQWGT